MQADSRCAADDDDAFVLECLQHTLSSTHMPVKTTAYHGIPHNRLGDTCVIGARGSTSVARHRQVGAAGTAVCVARKSRSARTSVQLGTRGSNRAAAAVIRRCPGSHRPRRSAHEVEREHLYLLGLGRPPGRAFTAPTTRPAPAFAGRAVIQPGILAHLNLDVLAWNRAASVALTDSRSSGRERNVLRMIFCNPQVRAQGE